jgi:hypothetical protein
VKIILRIRRFLITALCISLLINAWSGSIAGLTPRHPGLNNRYLTGIQAALKDDRAQQQALDFLQTATIPPNSPAQTELVNQLATILEAGNGKAAIGMSRLPSMAEPHIPMMLQLLQSRSISLENRIDIAIALGDLPKLTSAQQSQLRQLALNPTTEAELTVAIAQSLIQLKQLPSIDSQALNQRLWPLLSDTKIAGATKENILSTLTSLPGLPQPERQKILKVLIGNEPDRDLIGFAIGGIHQLGDVVIPYLPQIAQMLKDKNQSPSNRDHAAITIGLMPKESAPYATIADILKYTNDSTINSGVDFFVRLHALEALIERSDQPEPYLQGLISLINNPQQVGFLRSRGITFLGSLGDAAKPYIPALQALRSDPVVGEAVAAALVLLQAAPPEITPLIQSLTANISSDRPNFTDHQTALTQALLMAPPITLEQTLPLLNATYQQGTNSSADGLFLTYLYAGHQPEVAQLLPWLGPNPKLPKPLNHAIAQPVLTQFDRLWNATKAYPQLHTDLAQKILQITNSPDISWPPSDRALLHRQYERLQQAHHPTGKLDTIIQSLVWWQRFYWGAGLVGLFGLSLIVYKTITRT